MKVFESIVPKTEKSRNRRFGQGFSVAALRMNVMLDKLGSQPQRHEDTKIMKVFEPIAPESERVAKTIVDAALKVHRALGPGLLESVYELCLTHELKLRGVPLECQVKLPIAYEGLVIDAGLRLDIIVANQIVVEVKSS